MLNRKALQYLLIPAILIITGLWFLQNSYFSSISPRLIARERLQKTIEVEYQKLSNKKSELEKKDIDEEKPVTFSKKKTKKPSFPLPKITKNNTSKAINRKKYVTKSSTLAPAVTTTSDNPILGLRSVIEAEDLYYKTITKDTITCPSSKRFGRSDDGGWDVCVMKQLEISKGNCMVYSFGVNYIWEFDDELSTDYRCTVRTFDPSMTNEPDEFQRPTKVWFYKIGLGGENTVWANGWKIKTLSSLLKQFNEQNRIIDILKIDIEFSEWDSFTAILKDGLFSNVKQLLFETHTEEVQSRKTTMESFIRFLNIWNALYKLGFRQWKHHWNHFGNYESLSGVQRTCCYEHYLINKNFL